MNKKLSKPMQKVIKKMRLGDEFSAYGVGVSVSTMIALYKRKLIDIAYGENCDYDNRNRELVWKLTEAGQIIKESF
jgi:hypothetical protein